MSYAHPEYLISPTDLAADLEARRILDATVFLTPRPDRRLSRRVGTRQVQRRPHPGAQFFDLIRDASDTSTGLGFSVAPVGQLERLLRTLGISNDTEVVLYSTGHMMWATRAWWLLHYCGHQRVRVLDGGLRAWRDSGLPVATDSASFPEGDFEANANPALFVDKDAVLGAIGDIGVCTVNALAPEVYAGEGDFSYGRKGHITGSINTYFDEFLDGGCFKDADALREVLDANGLLSAAKVIAYCGGGISATIDAFACLLCGQEQVTVYDGSMAEWVRDESLPMETGR